MLDEAVKIRGLWRVEKFWADDDLSRAIPYDVVEGENLVTTVGAQAIWNRLVGTSVTDFSATNCRLAVGIGTTAAAQSDTDLVGATKTRKIVDGAPTVSGRGITWVSTFTTADANHAWNEAGVSNAASGGTLLNRVVQSFGTKTSSVQWVLTASVTLS